MGIIFIMPFPQMLHTTTTSTATNATGQLAWQLLTALELRLRPMAMIMGPVTMGGKKRITRLTPKILNSRLSTRYKRPAQATPKQA